MGIKEDLRADSEEAQHRLRGLRCNTCKWLKTLTPEDQATFEEVFEDRSFTEASISRWAAKHGADPVPSVTSISTHRKKAHRL